MPGEFKKISDELLCTVWSLVMVRNQLRNWSRRFNRTAFKSVIFQGKAILFEIPSVSKYIPNAEKIISRYTKFALHRNTTQAEQAINLLLLNNSYPAISYRTSSK